MGPYIGPVYTLFSMSHWDPGSSPSPVTFEESQCTFSWHFQELLLQTTYWRSMKEELEHAGERDNATIATFTAAHLMKMPGDPLQSQWLFQHRKNLKGVCVCVVVTAFPSPFRDPLQYVHKSLVSHWTDLDASEILDFVNSYFQIKFSFKMPSSIIWMVFVAVFAFHSTVKYTV